MPVVAIPPAYDSEAVSKRLWVMTMGVVNDMRVNRGTCETIRDPDLPYLRVKNRRMGCGGGSRSCENRGIRAMAPLRRHGSAQRSKFQETRGLVDPLPNTTL